MERSFKIILIVSLLVWQLFFPSVSAFVILQFQGNNPAECFDPHIDLYRQVDNTCVDICIDKQHTLEECEHACTY